MLVSELIGKLRIFMEAYGDLPVCYISGDPEYPTDVATPKVHDKGDKSDTWCGDGYYDRWCGL